MTQVTPLERGPAPRRSAVWGFVLTTFIRTVPAPFMRLVRRRMPEAPIEEVVIRGRRSGRERRMLVGLLEVDGHWYIGSPTGSSQWVRNIAAAGSCTVIRRDGIPVRVTAVEVDGAERERAIHATRTQPAPAGQIYRGAHGHIRAVGRYFRLDPVVAAEEAN